MSVRRLMIWLGVAASLGGVALAAGPFVPAAEGVVALRRDRVPLDVDGMLTLSQQLAVLAAGQGGARPEDRRAVAQGVALALVLQPGNSAVRKFAEQFGQGQQAPQGDARQLAEARAGGWETLKWLASPTAEGDGHALAACLGDVMAVADPKHPQAVEHLKNGEQGAWQGWVAPLAAFKLADAVPRPPPDLQPAPAAVIQLANAKVTTVLWTLAAKAAGGSALRPLPLTMTATSSEPVADAGLDAPPPPFSCRLKLDDPWGGTGNFQVLSQAVRSAIEAEHGAMPAGISLTFAPSGGQSYGFEVDRDAITGALAVLMDAAVSGVEPRATVIGEIRKDGSFHLPLRAWERLRALAHGGGGGRLVLPTEADPLLPSILALEEPEFFLKYEVLLASNLKELIERSAKTPTGGLADASARFAAICEKRGTQSVPTTVANRLVRQRLEEIVRDADYHGSARMLAIQGSGKRPTTLPRPLLATELLMALRPMAWIVTTGVDELGMDALTQAMDACKKGVARLDRYTEMRDRNLLDQANDLITGIRTLMRALRNRTANNGFFINHDRDFEIFKRSYETTIGSLKVTAGTR
ncbi:MAG: hypothetical protein RLZZ522_1037 [Verrucomicrobiota bacterium]